MGLPALTSWLDCHSDRRTVGSYDTSAPRRGTTLAQALAAEELASRVVDRGPARAIALVERGERTVGVRLVELDRAVNGWQVRSFADCRGYDGRTSR